MTRYRFRSLPCLLILPLAEKLEQLQVELQLERCFLGRIERSRLSGWRKPWKTREWWHTSAPTGVSRIPFGWIAAGVVDFWEVLALAFCYALHCGSLFKVNCAVWVLCRLMENVCDVVV